MDPAQLQPGHRLDRYELLCPLAYGGMAAVWLARFGGRKAFERLVVVKMILPQYSQDPRFQEMFLDEARIASRIEHPNVARIVDVGEQEDNTFIVMQWVDGDSLSKVARAAEQKKQAVPAGIVLRVCADAAAGLHAAHELSDREGTPLGVVHRDVSPQNILISNSGSTLIIDFGVAKARDRVSQETSAGQLKGKIRYMAPEQALGRDIDRRADVWALGAILYELFAGVPPYDGPNEVATLHKLTSGELPAPLPIQVPAPVRAVVARALAYEAEARYATALELNLALESCLLEIGEPTTTAAVARYTSQLLAERKAARKRAVDTALASAHGRDAERVSNMPPAVATPGIPIPRTVVSAAVLAPPAPPPPQAEHESNASPSHGPMGSMGLAEVPSATSSATLGSAAMEYPPRAPIDDRAPGRRYLAAAALGVSIAAGVVGAVLIVSTAVLGVRAKEARPANGTTVATAPQEGAPQEAPDAPLPGAEPASESVVAPDASVSTTTTTSTPSAEPEPVELPSTTTTVAPPPSTTTTTTVTPPSRAPSPAAAAPHRPPPAAPVPRPKPAPAPATPATSAPTGGKPDRGF
jgi:eukaryotic-like serine/threonine-protein kinase